MSSRTIRLAMDYGHYVPCDIEGNLLRIGASIERAIEEGCDIVCFPEAAVTGYSSKDICSVSDDDGTMRSIARMSKNITVVVGAFERCDRMHITQYVFRNGDLIGKYRKTHLGMNETVFTQGDDLPVFDAGVCNIGIQICWEMHFPEITATYRIRNADLVLNPTASGLPPERRMASWKRLVSVRAEDNRLFYAACNHDNESVICCGPDGKEIDGREIGEHLTMYELDFSLIDRYRAQKETMSNIDYPKHFRPELYDL